MIELCTDSTVRKNLEQLVYSSHTMTIVSENVKYNA